MSSDYDFIFVRPRVDQEEVDQFFDSVLNLEKVKKEINFILDDKFNDGSKDVQKILTYKDSIFNVQDEELDLL